MYAGFTCDVGDAIRLRTWDADHPNGFTDEAGASTAPTTTTLKIEEPDGVVTTVTSGFVAGDAPGKISYLYIPTVPGRYYFRWEGVGTVQAAAQGEFYAVEARPA